MENIIIESLESIKPYLHMDGGDVEFIKYEDDYIYVKLLGNCSGCPMKNLTLNNLIFDSLKEVVPNLKGIKTI